MASNSVEFKIKITDSGSFKKLEVDADDFRNAVKNIKTEADSLGSGLSKFSQLAIGINQAFDLVRNTAGKVGEAVSKIVGAGTANELQKLNLTTLFRGNAEAADEMFARISKYGKETVYDKEGLIEAQKTMMSFGISGEQAFGMLQHIGDIAMGDSQKMQSLALAFSQATSTGKLMGQDLMQMINAGFNPLSVISEHTGESISSLKEKMGEGAISADMLAQAFAWATEEGALFYQGAESAGKTTQGKLNELEDTFNEFLIGVFNQMQPIINAVIDFSTRVLNAIPDTLDTIRTAFGNIFDTVSDFSGLIIGLAAAIGTLTIAINANKIAMAAQELALNLLIIKEKIQIALSKAWKAVQAALNAVLSANPIGLIVSAIALLVGAIATVVKNTSGWGETWESVVNYINKSLGQMVAWFKLKWLQISDFFLTGIESIMRAWYKLQSLWDEDAARSGLANMQSKADERAKAIAEQKGVLEGKRLEREETTVTWSVKWERKSQKDEDVNITPAVIDKKSLSETSIGLKDIAEANNEVAETTKGIENKQEKVTQEAEKQKTLWEKQKEILAGVLDSVALPVDTIQKVNDAVQRLTEKRLTATYDQIAAIDEEIGYYEYLKKTIENGGDPLQITIAKYREIKHGEMTADTDNGNMPTVPVKAEVEDFEIKGLDDFSESWGGIKGIGDSIRDINSALTESDDLWSAITGTVDGFISLMQGITQVVPQVVQLVTALTAVQEANATANAEAAATGAAASVASMPWVGPALAVAAVASVVAALASMPKFANGGLVYGPTLGLMGEYGGASSNPEVIAPLSKLKGMLAGGSGSSEVKFRIEGRELVGIMNKQNNIYGRVR